MLGLVIIVVVGLVMLYIAYWGVKDPRGIWWAVHGWRYQDPAANEPSGSRPAF